MRLDKLTERSQDALQYAQELAQSKNHSQIEIEHLLSALLSQDDSLVADILSGSVKEGQVVELSLRGGEVVFRAGRRKKVETEQMR